MFLPLSLLHLWLCLRNGRSELAEFAGDSVAAHGVGEITGATPAFAAVSRHNAFSSLLSSLWGSHLFRGPSAICVFANQSQRFSMNIKPQVKVETVTLSVTGVEKRLVDRFRQRCEEMDGSAQGFIMNQILEAFLKSKVEKKALKRKAAAA
jgi:hypothetical protein